VAAGLRLDLVSGDYAVWRLAPDAPLPSDPGSGELFSVTRTAEEVSVVCGAKHPPEDGRVEGPFAALRVGGTLDFSLTGILASLTVPIAEAGVSVFALSTYDTDYLLIPRERLGEAIAALTAAGHELVGSAP
jgi:uncharacterized protein